MLTNRACRRAFSILTALAVLAPVGAPAQEPETDVDPAAVGDSVPRTGRLEGRVLDSQSGKGAPGASVFAYHLDSGAVFTAPPTDHRGRYRLEGLPLGWLDLYVETSDGLFAANQVVNMPPRGEVDISLELTKFEDKPASWGVGRRRDIPGVATAAVGEARLDETARGKSFWRTPTGIAVAAGGAAVVIAAIATSGSSNNKTTASSGSP
jgi:hypothetical protein